MWNLAWRKQRTRRTEKKQRIGRRWGGLHRFFLRSTQSKRAVSLGGPGNRRQQTRISRMSTSHHHGIDETVGVLVASNMLAGSIPSNIINSISIGIVLFCARCELRACREAASGPQAANTMTRNPASTSPATLSVDGQGRQRRTWESGLTAARRPLASMIVEILSIS